MKVADQIGMAASDGSVATVFVLLENIENGRMFQGGAFFELIAFVMFGFVGARRCRWWLQARLL